MTKAEKDIGLLWRSLQEKWLPILLGYGEDNGHKNCPLCDEYNRDEGLFDEDEDDSGCSGCPIVSCVETPYERWAYYYFEWKRQTGERTINSISNIKLKDILRAIARKEIYFLMGLIFKLRRNGES